MFFCESCGEGNKWMRTHVSATSEFYEHAFVLYSYIVETRIPSVSTVDQPFFDLYFYIAKH